MGTIALFALVEAWGAQMKGSSVERRFAYVFWADGEFVKLDLQTQEMLAHWMLSRVAGVSEWVGPFHKPNHPWLPAHWRYDANRQLLYGVVQVSGFEDTADVADYAVLALRVPLLEFVRRFEPFRGGEATVQLSPDGEHLFVSYIPAETERYETTSPSGVIEVYNTDTGAREIKSTQPRHARLVGVDPDNETLYDRELWDLGRLTRSSGQYKRASLRADEILNESSRETVAAHLRASTAGEASDRRLVVGSTAAGRVLILLVADQTDVQGTFVVEAKSGHIVAPFIPAPAKSYPRLTADGQRVLYEGIERRPFRDGTQAQFDNALTGQVWAYDATSGQLLRQFGASELSGFADEVVKLCEAADGAGIYRVPNPFRLYWVDPSAEPVLKQIATRFYVGTDTTCVITDR